MNQEVQKIITDTVRKLLEIAGFEAKVKITPKERAPGGICLVSLESDGDLGPLIGKNGQNINSLEHIIRTIVSKKIINKSEEKEPFVVDINDYRKTKSGFVIELARSVAKRVSQTQKAEALLPMTSYERRLVHADLAVSADIRTESIGEEPRRRVVIKPLLAD